MSLFPFFVPPLNSLVGKETAFCVLVNNYSNFQFAVVVVSTSETSQGKSDVLRELFGFFLGVSLLKNGDQ